jgi:hypothetical protein
MCIGKSSVLIFEMKRWKGKETKWIWMEIAEVNGNIRRCFLRLAENLFLNFD